VAEDDWHAWAASVAATLLEHRARNGGPVLVPGHRLEDRGAEISEWRRQFRSIE